jgi:Protein of unknown function (DUF1552)
MAICIPRKPLSRRTILRGMAAGAVVSLGVPRLGAMLNSNGTAYAAGAPLPKRFGIWFWGNGIIPPRWIPASAGIGAAWTPSEQMMPFMSVRKNFTALTGYEVKFTGGVVHHIGPAAALSGANHSKALNYTAPTIDFVISKLTAANTPFPTLQVGVSRASANALGDTVNYASSSGPDAPVQPEYDAAAVFTRLFGKPADGTASIKALNSRKRVLDTVSADAKSLRARLGVDDARRLDQHFDSIQLLEQRIASMGGSGACGPSAASVAQYPPALVDSNGMLTPAQNAAMVELVTYAWSCDINRVFLFQHGRPAAHYNMGALGITKDIHDDISHQEPGDQPIMNSAILYWFNQGRVLMENLQNTPDGAGNLLENSLIYGTSDVSFGRTHSTNEYPIMLFGRLGGLIKGDQHVRSNKDNLSKILLTLVNLYGGNVTTFGSGAGLVTSGISEILTT